MLASLCPQELIDDARAALILASLKYVELDPETAAALHAMKTRILNHPLTAQRPEVQELPAAGSHNNMLPGQPQLEPGSLLNNYGPPDIPPIPRLAGKIGRCSKPFEKQLTCSDVRSDQSRLSMNKTDVERCLLPLLNNGEDPIRGIGVTTYDPYGNEYRMIFKLWASKVYVLTAGWNEFYQQHRLVQHQDFVTIWMFRHALTGKLCFVITWRRLPIFEPIRRRIR